MADVLEFLGAHVKLVLAALLAGNIWLLRRYFAGGVCKNKVSLKGKTAIITGANCGIGKEVALDLARRQARVILACRSLERGEKAAKEILSRVKGANVVARHLELASLASVREFANGVLREEPRLDILVNNAGVFHPPEKTTDDGLEIHYGVNHLGHFLLTHLLLDLLQKSTSSRIVVVSSSLAKTASIDFENFHGDKDRAFARDRNLGLYAQSKLANLLFVQELSKRLPQGELLQSKESSSPPTPQGKSAKITMNSR